MFFEKLCDFLDRNFPSRKFLPRDFEENEKKPLGWTTSVNVDILQVETSSNIKAVMAAWNKKTANWLFRYVYNLLLLSCFKCHHSYL